MKIKNLTSRQSPQLLEGDTGRSNGVNVYENFLALNLSYPYPHPSAS